MTVFAPADTLRKHRPLLLAMEAVGWLHMAGKANVEFLLAQSGQPTGYDDLRWHERESPPFPWSNLLAWVKNRFAHINGKEIAWPNSLTEFLSRHREYRAGGLLGLLQAAHGITSGIEKNVPASTSEYLRQDTTHIWFSSAFGHPQRNLLADSSEILGVKGWTKLLAQIRVILEELKKLGEAETTDVGVWLNWRESAVEAGGILREVLSCALAETRLPNNDVTVWDQSYVAAALFKSALASAILEETFPWSDTRIRPTIRWRLLTVGIGADHYEARSIRIADWTGARQAIDGFFRQARRLIEVDLAVGSMIYTDGMNVTFSFPGERFNASGSTDLDRQNWQSWLQAELDTIAESFGLETPPFCHISDSTRSLVPLVEEIRESRETLAVPLHRPWKISSDVTNGHVCPVCVVRHTGNRRDKQAPCSVCARRRRGRLDTWLCSQIECDSIWLNELADTNDRIALLTLSLELEPWLDATRLDSLRAQSIADWLKHNSPASGQVHIDPLRPVEGVRDYIERRAFKRRGGGWKYEVSDPVLSSLTAGYAEERELHPQNVLAEELWKSFFNKIVEDRVPDGRPTWDRLSDDQRAHWLAHQLFRKLPSPGRVYRFWRQAEQFFEELLGEFRQVSAENSNRWRMRRLILKPQDGASATWQDREIYDGRWRNEPIVLLYDDQRKAFITASNLARLLRSWDSKDALRNETIGVRAESDDSERQLTVAEVRDDIGRLGVYHPVIPLEISPLRFRVLVPLEAASACVDLAISAWEREFARVWDRLPLRVGIVAFPQKLPFQAVIESARNIEDHFQSPRPEPWRVVERNARDGIVALDLERPNKSRELRTVPIRLPDGRDDVFYTYVEVEDQEVRFPHDFKHPRGKVYRHMCDLRRGDAIQASPSCITTVFIDAAAKRFDLVEPRPLAEWRRMRETWHLIERTSPSLSALRGAWMAIAEKQTAWRGPDGSWLSDGKAAWTNFIRAVLNDALSAEGAVLDALAEAAADGVLEWAIEWHLSVLKKKLSGG